jgi:hypothetical protein
MNRDSSTATKVLLGGGIIVIIVVVVVVTVLVTNKKSSKPTALSATGSVLSPTYAKSIGFPRLVQAAKKTTETNEKGCSDSIDAVYEDGAKQTGLISDVLNCGSTTSASTALAAARKQVTVDPSLKAPAQLGSQAFVTATNAPEYLVVWKSGNRVAITAIDVNVPASSTSSSTTVPSTPITSAQVNTLYKAALQQNSLYQ